MKKSLLFAWAITALIFGACSSDDEDNDTKIVVDRNVSGSELEQKSGGVYFVSTLAGEYIFRLNLKNGDDAVICEMFHDEDYSELAPAETTWEPGEVLENLQFTAGEVKLILSLNEDGEGEAQVFVEDTEFEVVVFKSTVKEPVKVYSGITITEGRRREDFFSRIIDEVIIIQDNVFFYGLLERGSVEDYRFGFGLEFSNMTNTSFTYQMPDSPNAHLSGDVWERENAEYDEELISWSYEDDNPDANEYFHSQLTLHRRFKN